MCQKTFQNWLKNATEEERSLIAKEAGTTVAYLWQLAGKHRKPSVALVAKLNKALNRQVDITSILPELANSLETA